MTKSVASPHTYPDMEDYLLVKAYNSKRRIYSSLGKNVYINTYV